MKKFAKRWEANPDITGAMPSQKLMDITYCGLRPSQLALFMVILEAERTYGVCTLNQESLMQQANVSKVTVIRDKRVLAEKGLIEIVKKKSALNGRIGDVIHTYMTDNSLWKKFRRELKKST